MTATDVAYLVFDTETTGVDTANDRIVQLFIGLYDHNGEELKRYEWYINPGIPVPEAAAEVHGFTTEFLEEVGGNPQEVLDNVFDVFNRYHDATWVAFNLNFDLSILDAEFRRHDVHSAFGATARDNVQLFDPIVVDRHFDKYRKGKRTLQALAGHYGIPFDADEAHNAGYDVALTVKVALAVEGKYGIQSVVDQARFYRTWAEHLEEYFRRTDPEAVVEKGWPLRG